MRPGTRTTSRATPTKTPTPRRTPTRTATRTTTDGPPVRRSFIERHGLVRYARGLGERYPREGLCEIGICRAYGIDVESGRLVFDHCHAHGWVRGLVCVPCNNRLMHVETGLGPALPEWQLPALAAHLMKCPECREQSG